MLRVIAIFQVKPEDCKNIEKLLLPLIKGSRADKGNISYVCNADKNAPGTYIFQESWENNAVLDEHMQQPHFIRFGQEAGPLFTAPIAIHVLGDEIK